MVDGTRREGLNDCDLAYCEVLACTMYQRLISKNETLSSQ